MMVVDEASFDGLLRDKLAELDADERELPIATDDPLVERLRLDAKHRVLAQQGGQLQRQGHQVYLSTPETPVQPVHRQLDLRY